MVKEKDDLLREIKMNHAERLRDGNINIHDEYVAFGNRLHSQATTFLEDEAALRRAFPPQPDILIESLDRDLETALKKNPPVAPKIPIQSLGSVHENALNISRLVDLFRERSSGVPQNSDSLATLLYLFDGIAEDFEGSLNILEPEKEVSEMSKEQAGAVRIFLEKCQENSQSLSELRSDLQVRINKAQEKGRGPGA